MLTPTTPNFNCNSPPFLIKIKRRAKKWWDGIIFLDSRFAWRAKLASPPAPHSTLIIKKYSTVSKFLGKPRENVISESHQNLISIWPGSVDSLEQICEAVQALQSNMWFFGHLEFCWKNEKRETILLIFFSGLLSIQLYLQYYQILIISQNEQNWKINWNPKK